MKTEEIKPGDILYDREQNLLVKVGRVDENGKVKYSAYTNMKNIFHTSFFPYSVGRRTADSFEPATEDQCKYMERELAACAYAAHLPNDQPLEHALLRQYTNLVKENVELEQRAHQLMDDYNKLMRQFRGMKKGYTKSAAQLKNESLCNTLSAENEHLKTYVSAVNDFMVRNKLYVSKKSLCLHKRERTPVGSVFCLECSACLKAIDGRGVVCLHSLKDMKVSIDEG